MRWTRNARISSHDWKATAAKQPILIMGHTDVVGVQPEKWYADPFSGMREDGYIYGRGTLDDKDNVAAGMMVMILLERLGVELDRDVIFLAESGRRGNAGSRHQLHGGKALGRDRGGILHRRRRPGRYP